jgi:hypothetical protein
MACGTHDTYADFLDSLKSAGVEISNEPALRERLAETSIWRYAFLTMARNGRAIGIRFIPSASQCNMNQIRQAFSRFKFPANADNTFTSSLALD